MPLLLVQETSYYLEVCLLVNYVNNDRIRIVRESRLRSVEMETPPSLKKTTMSPTGSNVPGDVKQQSRIHTNLAPTVKSNEQRVPSTKKTGRYVANFEGWFERSFSKPTSAEMVL